MPVERNPFAAFVSQRTKSLIDGINEVDHTYSKEHVRRVKVPACCLTGLLQWPCVRKNEAAR